MPDEERPQEEASETAKWVEENDPDGYRKSDLQPKDKMLDILLDYFVGFDDDAEGSIGVTLQIPGGVVSGMAVSRTEWIKGTVNLVREGISDASVVGDAIESTFDLYSTLLLDKAHEREEADLPRRARKFIHLKNVRIVFGRNDVLEVPFWRGSLEDVSGWSLGNMTSPSEG